jgi:predicted transcriptional regulator
LVKRVEHKSYACHNRKDTIAIFRSDTHAIKSVLCNGKTTIENIVTVSGLDRNRVERILKVLLERKEIVSIGKACPGHPVLYMLAAEIPVGTPSIAGASTETSSPVAEQPQKTCGLWPAIAEVLLKATSPFTAVEMSNALKINVHNVKMVLSKTFKDGLTYRKNGEGRGWEYWLTEKGRAQVGEKQTSNAAVFTKWSVNAPVPVAAPVPVPDISSYDYIVTSSDLLLLPCSDKQIALDELRRLSENGDEAASIWKKVKVKKVVTVELDE